MGLDDANLSVGGTRLPPAVLTGSGALTGVGGGVAVPPIDGWLWDCWGLGLTDADVVLGLREPVPTS